MKARVSKTATATTFDPKEIYERTGRKLITPSELQSDSSSIAPLLTADERQAMEKVVGWMRNYIMTTVDKAGKKEAVCPFVKPAIDTRLIYMSVAQLNDPTDKSEIKEEVRRHADIYEKIPGKKARDAILRSLLLLFPWTPDTLITECMPAQHRSLKTQLMGRGIMVGEFFPSDDMRATWDDKLRLLPSPVPFYIIRTFIENDWRFINHIPAWRTAFKKHFGEAPKMDLSISERLQRLTEEIAAPLRNKNE